MNIVCAVCKGVIRKVEHEEQHLFLCDKCKKKCIIVVNDSIPGFFDKKGSQK